LNTYKDDLPPSFYNGTLQSTGVIAWESELDSQTFNAQKSDKSGTTVCSNFISFNREDCTLTTTLTCGFYTTVSVVQLSDLACSGGGGGGGGTSFPSEPGGSGSDGGTPIYTPCDGATLEGVPCTPLDEGNNTIDVPEPPEIQITIDPSFANNDKAMCIFNRLKEDEDLKSLLSDFANPSLGFNVNLSLGSNITDKRVGGYTENRIYEVYDGKVNIVMNQNTLANMSPIEFAKNLAHELIHAHILAKVAKTGGFTEMPTSLPELWRFYELTKKLGEFNPNAAQHNYTAQVYFTRLVNIIKAFDNSQYSNEYYQGLAWQGLEKSLLWKNKSKAAQTYLDNRAGDIKTTSKQQDPCN
jgi:hypothetical protein